MLLPAFGLKRQSWSEQNVRAVDRCGSQGNTQPVWWLYHDMSAMCSSWDASGTIPCHVPRVVSTSVVSFGTLHLVFSLRCFLMIFKGFKCWQNLLPTRLLGVCLGRVCGLRPNLFCNVQQFVTDVRQFGSYVAVVSWDSLPLGNVWSKEPLL